MRIVGNALELMADHPRGSVLVVAMGTLQGVGVAPLIAQLSVLLVRW